MAKSLKSANVPGLVAVIAANLFGFLAMQGSLMTLADATHSLADLANQVMPASIAVAVVFVINGLMPADAKARIVFLRWDNPLPGSEAFSRYLHTDPRISVDEIERKYGDLPSNARDQNALWYRMYKAIADEPAVSQVHRAYLFTRDFAAIALMLLVLLGPAAAFQFSDSAAVLSYGGIMSAQLALAIQSARNYGKRFVTTVLAITSSKE
ncbi:hypothetical protein [Immundisolibacter sp.]|uniref:hypothetical protein n=1 Tax=Immundisolibacter sp. TaxID=1934948 RepID=UPI003F824F51